MLNLLLSLLALSGHAAFYSSSWGDMSTIAARQGVRVPPGAT